MFGMGMPEILVILAVALIVIGPKKLPDLAKSLGRAINEFRKATTDLKESLIVDTEIKEVKSSLKGQNNPVTTSQGGEEASKAETSGANTVKPVTPPQDPLESEKNA
jgi:sec-independent protein translocase protein TatB